MSIELKFRCWHDGKMYWGIGLATCTVILYNWARICTDYAEGTDPELYEQKCISPPELGRVGRGLVEIMQFTGLKDKTGEDLYAEDICSQEGEPDFIVKPTFGGFIGVDISGWDPMASPFPLVGADMMKTKIKFIIGLTGMMVRIVVGWDHMILGES